MSSGREASNQGLPLAQFHTLLCHGFMLGSSDFMLQTCDKSFPRLYEAVQYVDISQWFPRSDLILRCPSN